MTPPTPPTGAPALELGEPPPRWRGARLLAGGIVVSLGAMALTRYPGVVEETYAAFVGPRISRGLSILTGWLPFSLASLLLAILVGALAVRSIRGLRRLRDGAPPLRVLAAGADWSAGVIGALLLLFYPLWGLNYARAPIDERLGIVSEAPLDPAALVALTRLAADRTNAAYRELHGGSEDIGVPTSGLADPVETSRA
ncbi:MAG: DUF3810 family protein, partial [Longimicrobiales bacterium]|nr:DUF3810 family protein [Longimicrobiales bacterium]